MVETLKNLKLNFILASVLYVLLGLVLLIRPGASGILLCRLLGGTLLLYGLFKGAREIAKKKALEKSGVMEVLFVYTLLSFLFVVPDAGNAMGLSGTQLLCVLAKRIHRIYL